MSWPIEGQSLLIEADAELLLDLNILRSVILPYRHKTYYGFDDGDAAAVFVSNNGQRMAPLPLRLDIVNHSPTGFAWGYSEKGAAQLAVAILADWTGCDHAARALHQWFKAAAIAGLPEKHWSLTDDGSTSSNRATPP